MPAVSTYYQGLLIVIMSSTCVFLFVATALAVTLDLFNLLKLRAGIRSKLHKALLLEIVATCVAAFGAFLNAGPLADKIETAKGHLAARLGSEVAAIGFSRINTQSAPGYLVAAAPYLKEFGISVEDVIPQGSQLVIANNLALYGGGAVTPTLSQNFLTQVNTGNNVASFTLSFASPAANVRFVRPALYAATASGVTHPAWRAYALDRAGREVSSHSEGLVRSFSKVPAGVYTLTAPGFDGISRVRFESDPRLDGAPFAAFSALLLEDLAINRMPPEQSVAHAH